MTQNPENDLQLIEGEGEANRTKYNFFTLPGEVRNLIYAYVFGGEDWIVSDDDQFKASKSFKDPLALQRTCKEVYKETSKLPFMLSAFRISGNNLNARENVPKGRCFVRELVAYNWGQGYKRSLLVMFPLVQVVHLVVDNGKAYLDLSDWYSDQGQFLGEELNNYARNATWKFTVVGKDRTFFVSNKEFRDKRGLW